MTSAPLDVVVRHVRFLAARETAKELTDRELLQRFSVHQDQAAFTMLMKRHGPLVWRLCRQMLGQHQDAEDAFQATFLVLARSARSIVKGQAVASWLYGVAYRVSMKARRAAAVRRSHERRARPMTRSTAAAELEVREVLALLDEEVRQLPERQRAAFVLCCLEGRSHAQAARELACKEGTLAVTLSRVRKLLRERLAKRGVTLTAMLAALELSHHAASASAPTALVQTTIQAATLLAAGKTAAALLNTQAAALTEGIMKTMMITKAKTVALFFCAITVLGTGVGLVTSQEPTARAETASTVPRANVGTPKPQSPGPKAISFERASEAAKAVNDPQQKARALLLIAQAQTRAGDKKAAAATLEQALKAAQAMEATNSSLVTVRWSIFSTIAGAQANIGLQDSARKTADLVKLPDPPVNEVNAGSVAVSQSFANQQVAVGLAKAGKFKEAVETVALIDAKSGYMKGNALVEIVGIQAKAGDVKGAKESIKAIRGDTSRAAALAAFASYQGKDEAQKTLDEAMQLADGVLDDRQGREERAFMLRHVALAQMELGDIKIALDTACEIPNITEKNTSGEVISFPFRERTFVEGRVQARDFKGAREIAETIDGDYQQGYQKSYALHLIAKGLAEAKDVKEALKLAEEIPHGFFKTVACIDIARVQALAGDATESAKIFEQAFKHAGAAVWGTPENLGGPERFRLLAAAQAEVGQEKAVEMWIGQEQSPYLRTWALVGLAEGSAKRQPR